MSSEPPRPWLRMETASCTSTLTESTHDAGESNPRSDVTQIRTIGQARCAFIDDLDLITFEDRDVDVLARLLAAVVLDDHQARLDHLEDEAEGRDVVRRSPDAQLAVDLPHAKMNACVLDDGGHLCERGRSERQRPLELHRMLGRAPGKKRHRNFRDVPLFTPQARPERRVDHLLDDIGLRQRRHRFAAARPRSPQMSGEMCVCVRCDRFGPVG